jgi:hypothetical protein
MQEDLKPLGVAAYSIWPNPVPIGKPSRVHQHTDIEIIVYEHGATTERGVLDVLNECGFRSPTR